MRDPVPWLRLQNGQTIVRTLVLAQDSGDSLDSLKKRVVALGGTVQYNYTSIRALSVVMPAARLLDLARHADVYSISPNQTVTRTGSLVQASSGASEPTQVRGLDGSGIGVAVLDSGIGYSHRSFSTRPCRAWRPERHAGRPGRRLRRGQQAHEPARRLGCG